MFRLITSNTGIGAVLKPHELQALIILNDAGQEYTGTKDVWEKANTALVASGQKYLSRATYINFLHGLDEAGTLDAVETTGKGGKRPLYRLKEGGLDEFKQDMAKIIMASLKGAFPETDLSSIVAELPN